MKCSFCGVEDSSPEQIIQGESGNICISCIINYKNNLDKKLSNEINKLGIKQIQEHLITPKEIKKKLDQYIIGQEEAKKTLSVAVYSHYRKLIASSEESVSVDTNPSRLHQSNGLEDVEIDKSNVLLIGPTGCGKTLLASTLARIVSVPFSIADATTLTEAGYVGDDVENILLRLIQNANYNIPWAQKGIIFIDEIDKIGRKSENTSITRDVSGEGVQQALLKIIEGTVASVPAQGGRKHPQSQNIMINTKNILFICGGAFVGIDKILEERSNKKKIGFNQKKDSQKDSFSAILPDDLVKFGMIPELVGRLPIICNLHELDKDQLKDVLTKPKNSILKQFEKILSFENLKLSVKESGYQYIIDEAMQMKTGARSIRNILEKIMTEILYQIPIAGKKTVVLSKETIEKKNYFQN